MQRSSEPIEQATAKYQFELDPSFPVLPEGGSLGEVPGVAVDSEDRVYVGNRSSIPVQIFDSSGGYLTAWAYNDFTRVHSITIAPDGAICIADDRRHVIRVFDSAGSLTRTLGTPGVASDTGVGESKPWIVQKAGPPFNLPTDAAVASDGSLFVSDGYGNARVHHFDSDGTLVHSWGEPGNGPGQFNLPHGIAVNQRGEVLVADRENGRIQVFSADGSYQREYANLQRPCKMCIDEDGVIYVAELAQSHGRVTILDPEGDLLSRWTISADVPKCGAHSIALDSNGNIFVGLVFQGAPLPESSSPVLKYIRQA